jgi:putative peptidoglycan lipid II flippase
MTAPAPAQPSPRLSLSALGRPTALVTAGGVAGQVFALIRTLFVASRVGASPDLDALLVAEVLPVVVAGVIVGGMRSATLPAYVGLAAERGRAEASRFVGFILTWSVLVALLGLAVMYAFPGIVIDISGPGLSTPAHAAGLSFLPIVAPMLVLTVLWITLATVCQAEKRFMAIAAGLAINPLCSLLVTVLLWSQLGLQAVAWGLTAGYLATVIAVAAYLAASGLRPRLALTFDRREIRRFVWHAAPLVAGASLVQFNLLADRATASVLGAGAVSALNYGQLVVLQSIGSLSAAWMLVVYPSQVNLALPSGDGLGEGTERAMRHLVALFVPLTVGAIALAPIGVRVAYERGAFDQAATATTATVVAALAPLILLTMLQPVLSGAHNARRRGWLIGLTAALNAFLNVILDVAFGLTLGVAGIALSTSVTLSVVCLVLAFELRRLEPGFALRPLASTVIRSVAASLVPGIPIAAVVWLWLPHLTFMAAIAVLSGLLAVGAVAYVGVGLALHIEELGSMLRALAARTAFSRQTGAA